jgi:hypothetical protein
MNKRLILLLSGPVAVGKSTLASHLVGEHGFRTIRSGKYLQTLALQAGSDTSRVALQHLGDNLDERTDYAWLINDVAAPQIDGTPEQARWLLDSVRKKRQVEHFRSRFAGDVLHVHLTAAENVLRVRYRARLAAGSEYEGGTPYEDAVKHPNEAASRGLVNIADLVVDTGDPQALAAVVATVTKALS